MAEPLSLNALLQDSLSRTTRLIVPSFPFALLYIGSAGLLFWLAGALPEGDASFVLFSSATFAVLFAHCLFSASMYRAVLQSTGGLLNSAWRLTLAWLLMAIVAAIAVTIIVLFFSLIGASLGVVSGEAGQEITDMTAQMLAGGTFWPLFAVFLMTLFGLFWFAVRMMLFACASVVRGQVHVFRTWQWTKGRFWMLASLFVALIIVPTAALMLAAANASSVMLGPIDSHLETGLLAALFAFILVPSAWLGHGFAASVYARLAPPDADQTTTPA